MECYYCGDPATGRDHVVPYSYAGRVPSESRSGTPDPGETVPACSECNSLLGNRLFPSLQAKKAYIRKTLRKRYGKILRVPDWTHEDLEELGPSLKEGILRTINQKQRLLDRLSYTA